MSRRTGIWAVAIAVLLALVLVGTFGFIRFRSSDQSRASMKAISGAGFSVAYPSKWVVNSTVPQPTDVILLIRDPSPSGPFDAGLIMRKTTTDPHPIDQDMPGLTMANQFQHPDIVVLRKEHIAVRGGKEAILVVSEANMGSQKIRIVDIVVRTPSDAAYHLQAVAPPDMLTDAAIAAMVAGLRLS